MRHKLQAPTNIQIYIYIFNIYIYIFNIFNTYVIKCDAATVG